MLTYVIALNVSQARLYGLRKFRFVRDARDLAGVQGCLVVLTGQYYLRPDWHSLELLLTRLQNFSKVLVRLNPIDFIIAGSLESAKSVAHRVDSQNWVWVDDTGVIPRKAKVYINDDARRLKKLNAILKELDFLEISNPIFTRY